MRHRSANCVTYMGTKYNLSWNLSGRHGVQHPLPFSHPTLPTMHVVIQRLLLASLTRPLSQETAWLVLGGSFNGVYLDHFGLSPWENTAALVANEDDIYVIPALSPNLLSGGLFLMSEARKAGFGFLPLVAAPSRAASGGNGRRRNETRVAVLHLFHPFPVALVFILRVFQFWFGASKGYRTRIWW